MTIETAALVLAVLFVIWLLYRNGEHLLAGTVALIAAALWSGVL